MSLAGNCISWQSTGGVDSTPTAYTIFSCTVVARTCFTCCQSVQSHIDPMHLHGSSHDAHCLRFSPAMSYTLPHLMTPRAGTPSSLIQKQSFCEHKTLRRSTEGNPSRSSEGRVLGPSCSVRWRSGFPLIAGPLVLSADAGCTNVFEMLSGLSDAPTLNDTV